MERADEYLLAHPKEVKRWSQLFRRPNATDYLPPGTYESAYRVASNHRDEPYAIARSILRDAFNHGDAFVTSGADVPFLLKSTDRRFAKLLARGPNLNPGATNTFSRKPQIEAQGLMRREIAAQVVDLLSQLEIRAAPEGFDSFMRGDGHSQLVQWVSHLCTTLNCADQSAVDTAVLDALITQLGHGRFERPLRDILKRENRATTLLTTAGMLTTVGDMASGGSPWDRAGVAVATLSFGYSLLKETGYVPTRYNGPNWPFLYLDMKLRPRELSELVRVLQQIRGN